MSLKTTAQRAQECVKLNEEKNSLTDLEKRIGQDRRVAILWPKLDSVVQEMAAEGLKCTGFAWGSFGLVEALSEAIKRKAVAEGLAYRENPVGFSISWSTSEMALWTPSCVIQYKYLGFSEQTNKTSE